MNAETFTCPKCKRPVQVSRANLEYEKGGRKAYCSVCQAWTIHLANYVRPERNRPKHQSKKERLRIRRERKSA